MPLAIGYIIDQISLGVVGGDGHNFPVELTLVNHGQDCDGLHLKDLSNFGLPLSNLNNVDCNRK